MNKQRQKQKKAKQKTKNRMVGVREHFPEEVGGKEEGMLLQEEKKLDRNLKQQKSFIPVFPKAVLRPTASTSPGSY